MTELINRDSYLKNELQSNWGTICPLVEMMASDGKMRKIQAANAEGLFRIIQSISSPKAEPFIFLQTTENNTQTDA